MVVEQKDSVKGISGFFYSFSHSGKIFPFHGNIYFSEKNIFEGGLVDHWGPSEIKGTFEEERLNFSKLYFGRSDWLDYSFEKGKNDFFNGLYRERDNPHYGAFAICRIYDKIPKCENIEILVNLGDLKRYDGFFKGSEGFCDEFKIFTKKRPCFFDKPLDS